MLAVYLHQVQVVPADLLTLSCLGSRPPHRHLKNESRWPITDERVVRMAPMSNCWHAYCQFRSWVQNRNRGRSEMRKAIGILALMSLFAIDVSSAQTVTYQNRSSFGRARASVHQRHAAAFKQRAAARSRFSKRRPSRARTNRIDALRRARSNQVRAQQPGRQLKRIERERNRARMRSHIANRRTNSASVTSRAQQQQRHIKRAQQQRRPNQRTPRSIAW